MGPGLVPAVNRVLETRELLDEIFDHVSSNCRGLKSLGALARTSRFFWPSAARHIWHSIYTLDPLFLCLPDHAIDRRPAPPPTAKRWAVRKDEKNEIWTLSADIKEEDLTRVKIYASCVQYFGSGPCCSRRRWSLDGDAADRLLPFFGSGRSLFPQLKHAKLHVQSFLGVAALPQLVLGMDSPLEELDITCCPIPGLKADIYHLDEDLCTQWASIVSASNLKNLRRLIVQLRFHMDEYGAERFPIQKLDKVLHSRMLTNIDIQPFIITHMQLVQDLALLPDLSTLVINLTGFDSLSIPPLPEAASSHGPSYFPALRNLTVLANNPQSVCDAFIQADLHLYERTLAGFSSLSPGAVATFIGKLKWLERLTLRFDARSEQFPLNHDIIPNHSLIHWDVCTSYAEKSEDVTTFIESLAPNLQDIQWGWKYIEIGNYDMATAYDNELDYERGEVGTTVWEAVYDQLRLPTDHRWDTSFGH